MGCLSGQIQYIWFAAVSILFLTTPILVMNSPFSFTEIRLYVVLPLMILISYGFIFWWGYDAGYKYVTGTVPTHLLNDDTAGGLIRAGERGLLFVTAGDRR
jgi:hypothetical protein